MLFQLLRGLKRGRMGRDELRPGKGQRKDKDIIVPAVKTLVPCRFSDLQLLTFHCEVSSSIPDLCTRDMWWIEWRWNNFFFRVIRFTPSH